MEKHAVEEQLDVCEREKRERARGLQSSGSGSKREKEEEGGETVEALRRRAGNGMGPRFLRVPNCAAQVSRRRSASTHRV
jgi:hypothetical protein